MKQYLNYRYSLEMFMGLLALASVVAMLLSFTMGHYITPTIILADGIIFFNLCYFGCQDKIWAKYILFWTGVVISAHLFFSLFFAITPPKILGEAFFLVYVPSFMLFTFLTWHYARANQLFSSGS